MVVTHTWPTGALAAIRHSKEYRGLTGCASGTVVALLDFANQRPIMLWITPTAADMGVQSLTYQATAI